MRNAEDDVARRRGARGSCARRSQIDPRGERHLGPQGHECGHGSPARDANRFARRRLDRRRDRTRGSVREHGRADRARGLEANQRRRGRRHDDGANPVDVVEGLQLAVDETVAHLKKSARPLEGSKGVRAVACIAANDDKLGALVAEAFERTGPTGIVAVEFGATVDTVLDVVEGMAFDRGYISHHMVTDVERMEVVLDNPIILMTDNKIQLADELSGVLAIADQHQRPLLIIAEELAPPAVMGLLSQRGDSKVKIAAIHPPEFGHWRKAMLEDIAVATDGRVVARDLGGKVAEASAEDLGGARQVRISANRTLIIGGEVRPETVAARREQVRRQYDAAPENVERDKFKERLAKLSGGTAMILAGGATPVAQKRIAQLIEDAINATRAAMEEGVVAGGGISLMQTAPMLDRIIDELEGDSKKGAQLVRQALSTPPALIIANSGRDSAI